MLIRRLVPADAEVYLPLRRRALQESPFSFGSSPEDDRAGSLEWVREALDGDESALFGAFDGDLVGIIGIAREQKMKGSHKCDVWGLYVVPSARRQGAARALVTEAIRFARSLPHVAHVHLSVSDRAPAAMALYVSLGFKTWGVEPAAIRIGTVDASEHYMVLELGT
ncbi:MAG: GNAT family N-acetyltransferase [Acidobacteria bacterium]|nr:GNAT family N-acetyltransferase [Acidobacteriota bacterium]